MQDHSNILNELLSLRKAQLAMVEKTGNLIEKLGSEKKAPRLSKRQQLRAEFEQMDLMGTWKKPSLAKKKRQ